MKLPKTTKRYCPYCKKRTEQKIKIVSTGGKRGTLTRGSISRAKKGGEVEELEIKESGVQNQLFQNSRESQKQQKKQI